MVVFASKENCSSGAGAEQRQPREEEPLRWLRGRPPGWRNAAGETEVEQGSLQGCDHSLETRVCALRGKQLFLPHPRL